MKYEQYKVMQDVREIELRDSGSNVNTNICFEVRATALRPRLHTEDFHYVHTGPSIKGPPLRNYNSTPGVHNSSFNTQTSTQEVGTKPSKSKGKYT